MNIQYRRIVEFPNNAIECIWQKQIVGIQENNDPAVAGREAGV